MCSTGYHCVDSKCVPATGGKCSDDLTASIDVDGKSTPCGAFKCDTATKLCKPVCNSSDDCSQGNVCNLTSKTCEPPAPDTSSSGGCGVADRGTSTDLGAIAVLLAMLGTRATRARRRSARRDETR
jgi:hypothetical protein